MNRLEGAAAREGGSHGSNATAKPPNAAARAEGSVDAELFSEVAYAYDDTLEGLLTAIFEAYARHENPTDIAPDRTLQPRLGQRVARIETCIGTADRVRRSLCERCGREAYEAVASCALSDEVGAGTVAYRFVRHALPATPRTDAERRRARRAIADIAHPVVEPVVRIHRAVMSERHRMQQFLRFEHLEGDVWFARCNPNASVVPLLMDYFSARFNTQPFVIYDENHAIAGVYARRDWRLVRTDGLNLPARAVDEAVMQEAWRAFYRAVSIDARYHPELRRQFMPKRLWKNLTEMQEGPSGSMAERALPSVSAEQLPAG